MKTVMQIEDIIVETINKNTQKVIDNKDMHLLSDKLKIPVVEYLYVFDELEKKLDFPVAKIFEKNDYTVFTVHNFANAIWNKMTELNYD